MLGIDREIVNKTILAIGFFLNVLSCSFWEPIKEYTGFSIYYIGTAISYFCYALVLYRVYKNIWTELILAGTINVLLDELFFDPHKLSFNEYLFFTLATLWTLKREKDLALLKKMFRK